MLRVGYFIETEFPGGAEMVMLDLAVWARKKGHEPVFIDFGSQWMTDNAKELEIEHLVIPFRRLFKSAKLLPFFFWSFSRFLKQHKIDVLHSHLFGPITGAAPAAFIAGVPHIGTLHDIYTLDENAFRIRQVQFAAILGTHLVTVSRHMESFYRQRGWFPKGAIQTIYNGIDYLKYCDTDTHKSEQHTIKLICVGRLVELKQVAVVVAQCLNLLGGGLKFDLLIVGEGPESGKIEALLENNPYRDAVKLLGPRNDIPKLLQNSDIFVQFSTTEGLSRSILEAAAVGRAVVVSDVGGNSEIVVSGCGLLVPCDQPEALGKAIEQLIKDGNLRLEMGKKGRRHVIDIFSCDICNDKYIELYQRISG